MEHEVADTGLDLAEVDHYRAEHEDDSADEIRDQLARAAELGIGQTEELALKQLFAERSGIRGHLLQAGLGEGVLVG